MGATGTVFIYALVDPRTDELRYVGKTTNPQRRLAEHCRTARLHARSHAHYWIRSLLNADLAPQMRVLKEASADDWGETERRLIAQYRERGHRLTNIALGGAGGSTHARLNGQDILDIAHAYLSGLTTARIADQYAMTAAGIHGILIGKSWPNVMPAELFSAVRKEAERRRHGEGKATSVYTEEQVRRLFSLYLEGKRPAELARIFNMTDTYVCEIIRGEVWSHLHPGPQFIRPPDVALRGEESAFAKLDHASVLILLGRYGEGDSPITIASDLGVSPSCVHSIIRGKTWKGCSAQIDEARHQAQECHAAVLKNRKRDQDHEVVALRRAGVDIVTVAKRLHMSDATVREIIKREGLPDLRKATIQKGLGRPILQAPVGNHHL